MKPSSSNASHAYEAPDGPPLDFSFKGLRTIEQLSQNIPVQLEAIDVETKPSQPKTIVHELKQEEGKEIREPKLQIIRTINTADYQLYEEQQKKVVQKKEQVQKINKKQVVSRTTSLFLRYNKITSIEGFRACIQPLFPQWEYLMWVDLSHNRLIELTTDLATLPNLKTLYLHVNYIPSFKQIEKLKGSQLLRTLTIHGNPIEQYGEFRALISFILPSVKKIDSTLLTKRETERAAVLKQSLKKLPIIANPRKPAQQSENQQDC